MLKNLLHHIYKNHNGYDDKIQVIKNNDNIECLFLRLDNDFYLSQITFWDNFMYCCEIYDLKKDELLLDENLCLKNNNEQCLKFNDFIKTLLKIEKNL